MTDTNSKTPKRGYTRREPHARRTAETPDARARDGMDPTDGQMTLTQRQTTRAEQEARAEAERLNMQIETALQAVVAPTDTDGTELEAVAARLERAARDLAVALRELARERRDQDSRIRR